MRQPPLSLAFVARGLILWAASTCLGLFALSAWAAPPAELPVEQKPLKLTAEDSVQWALRNNPILATFRRTRGIAEAMVVVADQYPFNPIIQHFVWYGNGPASAGVTNHVFQEHTSRLDLEINGQGKFRRAAARSALTRTQWEIGAQELLVSIQVARAFNNLLYRQGKYRTLEETVRFQEETVGYISKLVEQGKMSSVDQLLARADVSDAKNALGPGRSLLVVAENDFRRAVGMVHEDFTLDGTLEKGILAPDAAALVQEAMERRPDLHGFEFAVQEADNRLRFEVANRWGNPSAGPAGEINETSVYFIGMWLIWQPPILNQRKGEIRQREAERARAIQAVHQGEILVQQDVYAARSRLTQAEQVVDEFRTKTLPELRKMRESIDKLYEQGQVGVDLARVLDIRRRLLRARDAYLDALFEQSQAHADLAAAVSDLSFVGCTMAAKADPNKPHEPVLAPPRPTDDAPR